MIEDYHYSGSLRDNTTRKIESFVSKFGYRKISGFVLTLLLAIALPVTLLAVQQRQNVRQQAAETAIPNKYGAHILSALPSEYNQQEWSKALVGERGYIKNAWTDISPLMSGPPADMVDFVNRAYIRNLIPVVRIDSVWKDRNRCGNNVTLTCEALALRIKDIVSGLPRKDGTPLWIEINNENNWDSNWGNKANGAEYGRLLLLAAKEIHSLGDNRIKVMNGGLAPDWGLQFNTGVNTERFIRDMFQNNPELLTGRNGMPVIDAWAVHPYPFTSLPTVTYKAMYPNKTDTSIAAIDSYLAELNVLKAVGMPSSLQVMLTEAGYTASEFSRDDVAKHTVEAIKYWNQDPKVIAFIPFVMSDFPKGTEAHGKFFSNHFWVPYESGTNADGTPTNPYPVYTAVRNTNPFVQNPPTNGDIPTWQNIEGITTDSPGTVVFNNKLYVFARGSGDVLISKSTTDGKIFSPWQSTNRQIFSTPQAVNYAGKLYLFTKGKDNTLQVISSTDGITFSEWKSLGGVLTSSPGSVSMGGSLYVYVKGTEDKLYFKKSSDGVNFRDWVLVEGAISSSPAAVNFTNTLYLFARRPDNTVQYKKSSDGISYSSWQSLGGVATSDLSALTYKNKNGQQVVSVVVRGLNNTLYEKISTTGTVFNEWKDLGFTFQDSPSGSGFLENRFIAVRGNDNAIWITIPSTFTPTPTQFVMTPTITPTRTPTPVIVKPQLSAGGFVQSYTPWVVWLQGTNLQPSITVRVYDTNGTFWGNGTKVAYGSATNISFTLPGNSPPSGCNRTSSCTIFVEVIRGADGSNRLALSLPKLPSPTTSITSTITVFAEGSQAAGVYATMDLYLKGVIVKRWTNVTGGMKQYTYTHQGALNRSDVRVEFSNDAVINGQDRNLKVDKISLNNTEYQSEASTTYTTSCSTGYKKTEWLYCNGYFQY